MRWCGSDLRIRAAARAGCSRRVFLRCGAARCPDGPAGEGNPCADGPLCYGTRSCHPRGVGIIVMANLWGRKPIAALEAEAAEPSVQAMTAHGRVPLRRTLTAFNLVALGIGAIIGAGIFVLTGHAAAANAGPAIVLSFVLGGIACAFAG